VGAPETTGTASAAKSYAIPRNYATPAKPRCIIRARLIADSGNAVWASAVSFYELHYKTRLGKLPVELPNLDTVLQAAAIPILAISGDHAAYAGRLDWDPWDRILAAQAQREGCALISTDAAFHAAGVTRIW
jgi:PIN domain nuclease of toxin-antitoxin system